MPEFEKSTAWRTFSESKFDGGFRVWEIFEVIGEVLDNSYIMKCRDGSEIYISCYHFWTEEKALMFFNSSY